MNDSFAADCLASTGSVFPILGIVFAVTLVIIGAVAVLVRKKLAKGAFILIPILILVAVVAGTAPRAEAATDCGGATTSASPSSSPSSSSSQAPAGMPVITNVTTTVDQSAPWTITVTGDSPIEFRYYTFSWPAFTAAHLTIDSNTGVVTPPVDQTLRSQACDSTPFNTISGISVTFEAVNGVGYAQQTFVIDDHVWCNSRG